MLDDFGEGLWIASHPLRFLGLEIGTRMTVVRLPSGGLFVHSPIPLDGELRKEIDALGPVTAIVAPCLYHHLYVADWARAYPDASVSGCPGLDAKRRDVRFTRVLGDAAPDEWSDVLDQVFFAALPLQNEVVFFHSPTKTLVTSDLLFNLAKHASGVTRAAAFLLGQREPGPTALERFMTKDRAAARVSIDRMLAWNPERIVLAHGDVVSSQGTAVLERAFAWLPAAR
jgi:hypothetical protein